MKRVLLGILPVALLAACGPIKTENHVIVEQPKPLEVNLNISGNINININDARTDMKQITGEAPARVVRPEDIGLPPEAPTKPGAMLDPGSNPLHALALRNENDGLQPVLMLADMGASEQSLKDNISGRIPQVQYLLNAHVAGEAHTGLLSARGTLTPAQQAILDAENKDRSALYALVAARKQSTVAAIGLSFYVARLGYVQPGVYIEKYDQQTKQWNWTTWK